MRAIAALALDHVRVSSAAPRQLAVIGLFALAMAVLGALRLSDLRDEERALREQYMRVSAKEGVAPRSAAHVTPAPPWDRLFGALETAAGADVGLLVFDPAPDRRQVRLEGEARDLQALLDYLRRAGAAAPFERAQLQNHQVVQDVPGHPVRFTLDLAWREGP